jgi:hypothetical protein
MMICLQEAALLALGQDDSCVYDLVEFGQIEQPAVESQAFVPHSSYVGSFWTQAICRQMKCSVGHRPGGALFIVTRCIAEPSRSLYLAKSIHNSSQSIFVTQVGE